VTNGPDLPPAGAGESSIRPVATALAKQYRSPTICSWRGINAMTQPSVCRMATGRYSTFESSRITVLTHRTHAAATRLGYFVRHSASGELRRAGYDTFCLKLRALERPCTLEQTRGEAIGASMRLSVDTKRAHW
jgi:hypothetical protein